jgi:uncharacterized spore protein YtfJ
MGEEINRVVEASLAKWDQGAGLIRRLLEVAQPSAVFGEPVSEGERTIITASEVSAGMGFGFGVGGGHATESDEEEAPDSESEDSIGVEGGTGAGGGGGSGGGAMARPVAVVSMGPEGVTVQPVVDVTKLGIALLTTLGAMWVMWGRIQRASRQM